MNKEEVQKLIKEVDEGIQKQIKAIEAWQNCDFVHPLTCCGDDCSEILEGKEHKPQESYGADSFTEEELQPFRGVYLECPKCGRKQNHIPDVVFQLNCEEMQKSHENLIKNLSPSKE
tara:strand:- start:5507 stop:5857 length:351 start_codon:yes stop_codon:yes gene_type:complete